MILSMIVMASMIWDLNQSVAFAYLGWSIINVGISLLKFHQSPFQLIQAWVFDLCLVLVGVSLVRPGQVLLSASVMFTIIFTQYFVLAITLFEVVAKHHTKVKLVKNLCKKAANWRDKRQLDEVEHLQTDKPLCDRSAS